MIDPANYSATETLPDGRRIEIRAQRPDDHAGLRAALARASPESFYYRFFSVKREFSEKEAHYFLDIDFVKHVALAAIADEEGRSAIVGGAQYIVVQPGQAEASFAVIDDYQGKGIGTTLMRHLATIGREAGLREFVAEVLSENAPKLKVFERSGLVMSAKRVGIVVHVTLRLA